MENSITTDNKVKLLIIVIKIFRMKWSISRMAMCYPLISPLCSLCIPFYTSPGLNRLKGGVSTCNIRGYLTK